MNSKDSVGSRLPSTFHLTTSNEHPLDPPPLALALVWTNPAEGIHHPEANPAVHLADLQEDPTFFQNN